MEHLKCYLYKAISGTKPILGTIITVFSYIMFPEIAYKRAATVLGVAMLMDIFSKYVVISINNGGFFKSLNEKKIFSRTLWEGTRIKLITYISISIMVGISYHLYSLSDSLLCLSKFMATVVYTVLYLREFQSMLENFKEVGADVDWLLILAEKKEQEILKRKGGKNGRKK